jgi:hypothetical protein
LKLNDFFSHKELSRNPSTKKPVAAMNKPMVATVSLSKKETIMGMRTNMPEICRTNPMLANSALIMQQLSRQALYFFSS